MSRNIGVVGAASGWGAQRHGCEFGPEVLFEATKPLEERLEKQGDHWINRGIVRTSVTSKGIPPKRGEETVPLIHDHCLRLSESVISAIQAKDFPVVIGGDHAVAIGTWSGVTEGLHCRQKIGLIWIDAHLDAHTPKTSPSQAYHGMPVAHLLGVKDTNPLLTSICSEEAKIRPETLVFFGIRSYEEGEQKLLESLNVRIYYMEEIYARGVDVCFHEAVQVATSNGTHGFGISFDIDAFDPRACPGVGSPEPNGLWPRDMLPLMRTLRTNPLFRALEITEFNPPLDVDNMALKIVLAILENVFLENPTTDIESFPYFTKKDWE